MIDKYQEFLFICLCKNLGCVCVVQTKGEISAERKERYEETYNNYQKLLSNTQVFAVSTLACRNMGYVSSTGIFEIEVEWKCKV